MTTQVQQTGVWLSTAGTHPAICQQPRCLAGDHCKQERSLKVSRVRPPAVTPQITVDSLAVWIPRGVGRSSIHRPFRGRERNFPQPLILQKLPNPRISLGQVHASLAAAEVGVGVPAGPITVPLPLEGPNAAPAWVRKAVADQPWRGGLEPCGNQSYTVDPASIDGQIPEELRGTIYRCGPGRVRIGQKMYDHWFDSDGMVYALELDGPKGSVKFTCRYVDTDRFKAQEKAGPERFISKGAWTLPEGLFDRIGLPTNPSNTSMISFGGRILSLCEGGVPMEVDPTTLVTRGPHSFGLDCNFSAHPKVDPKTGVLYNQGILADPASGSFSISVFAITPEGKVMRSRPIPQPLPSFVHDAAMSEHYFIIAVPPYSATQADMLKFALGLVALGHARKYDEARGTRILVVSKRDLSVVKDMTVEAFSTFHFGNAYEHEGKLHVHVNVLDGPREALEANFSNMYASNWARHNQHTLHDYVWDLESWQLLSTEPAVKPPPDTQPPYGMEFPQFNQDYAARRNRYTYVLGLQTEEEDENWKRETRARERGAGGNRDGAANQGAFPTTNGVQNGEGNGAGNGVGIRKSGAQPGGNYLNCLQKYDHDTGRIKTFQLPGQYPADTDFIPRAGSTEEDDGYLVSFFYEPARHGTNVVILDAKRFDGPPVATIKLPTHVPYYFHGCWAPTAAH